MVYKPPKLTPAEARRMKSAAERRNRDVRKANDAQRKAQDRLDEAYRKATDALRAKREAAAQAAKARFDAVENEVYGAIFDEEKRTGVLRERA